MNRVPGGMMVCPLFLGMVINTFLPRLLKIGGYTEAPSGIGYPTVLGMYLFTVGTKMTMNAAPKMLKRGFGIMATRWASQPYSRFAIAKLFHGKYIGPQYAGRHGGDERYQWRNVSGAHQCNG